MEEGPLQFKIQNQLRYKQSPLGYRYYEQKLVQNSCGRGFRSTGGPRDIRLHLVGSVSDYEKEKIQCAMNFSSDYYFVEA